MPLVELPGFEEATRRHTYHGTRALTLYHGPRHCRHCSVGEIISHGPYLQPALFYHGGYGATEAVTVDVCLACGRTHVTRRDTLNPRKLTPL